MKEKILQEIKEYQYLITSIRYLKNGNLKITFNNELTKLITIEYFKDSLLKMERDIDIFRKEMEKLKIDIKIDIK